MTERLNVFNMPVLSSTNFVAPGVVAISKKKSIWFWTGAAMLLCALSYGVYYLYKTMKAEILRYKTQNAQTQNAFERLNNTVNKEPMIKNFVNNQLSQNKGYPPSDNNKPNSKS
jgi:hypothetical protein